MTSRLYWSAALAAALLAAPAAIAMGSGGMGGGGSSSMPSSSEPAYDPALEYQKGVAALQAGKYKEAARAFQHVVDAQPRVANVWYMLGLAKAGMDDVKGAAKAYEKAVRLDGAPVAPRRELAISLAKLKQNEKANEQLTALRTQAGTCNDTCPEAADLKAAITAVEQALASANPAAFLTQPSSLIFASSAQGDQAYARAVGLINDKRYAEALAALDAAEAVFGPHPDILTYKGYVWRKLGHADQAEPYYQAALAVAPDHRGATEYYGELKVERGDRVGAAAMLAKLDRICTFGCAEAEELRRWIDAGGEPGR